MTANVDLFEHAEDAAAFLADDWQQRPRFLRGALASLPELPDWSTLCADEHIESRRVVTTDTGFEMTEGPFAAADLESSQEQPWTLLIQDADYHAPQLRCLLDAVRWLPTWRLEDIMMSVATHSASVGPHVDAYDVFLVQARGSRRWDVGSAGHYTRRPDDEGLRLIEPFEPVDEWLAEAGDVLYLPPDVPHHGVSQDDNCVTLSIGFRAPSLQDVAATVLAYSSSEPRYADPNLIPAAHAGHIDSATLARLREQLRTFAEVDDTTLLRAFGELVTEPKQWLAPEPRETQELPATTIIDVTAGSRLAFGHADGNTWLFANAERYAVPKSCRDLAQALANDGQAAVPTTVEGRAWVEQLFEDGVIDCQTRSRR